MQRVRLKIKSNLAYRSEEKPHIQISTEPKKRAIPQNAICHAPGTHPLHPSREMPCSLHSRKTLALASALKQWGTTTDGNSTNQQHPCPSGPWRCGSVYSRQWDGPSGIKAGPCFPGGSPCDPTRSIPNLAVDSPETCRHLYGVPSAFSSAALRVCHHWSLCRGRRRHWLCRASHACKSSCFLREQRLGSASRAGGRGRMADRRRRTTAVHSSTEWWAPGLGRQNGPAFMLFPDRHPVES